MVLFFFICREIFLIPLEKHCVPGLSSTMHFGPFLYTLENSMIDTEVLIDFTRSTGDMCEKEHAQKWIKAVVKYISDVQNITSLWFTDTAGTSIEKVCFHFKISFILTAQGLSSTVNTHHLVVFICNTSFWMKCQHDWANKMKCRLLRPEAVPAKLPAKLPAPDLFLCQLLISD